MTTEPSYLLTRFPVAYYLIMLAIGAITLIAYVMFDVQSLPSRFHSGIAASPISLTTFKISCLLLAYWGLGGWVMNRHPQPPAWGYALNHIVGLSAVVGLSAAYLL